MTKTTVSFEQLECNRCGGITDDVKSDLKGAHLEAQTIMSAGLVMPSYGVDLCGKCLDSFIDWWNHHDECALHAKISRTGPLKKEFLRG